MLLKELKINISWLLVIKENKTHHPNVRLLYLCVMVTCLIKALACCNFLLLKDEVSCTSAGFNGAIETN